MRTAYTRLILIFVVLGFSFLFSLNSELLASDVPLPKKENAKRVPILYYHCVSDKIFGLEELFVSPGEFAKQMKFLQDNNYNVITFADLDKIASIKNPVLITFDDGYENNYLEAYPILKKYGFPATIFINTNSLNQKNKLKESQVKKMRDLISFQSHTLSHANLTQLSNSALESELSASKKVLERLTGQKVNVLAYPHGAYNKRVIFAAKKYYQYAVTNKGGLYNTISSDKYTIRRVYIPRDLKIEGFARKIKWGIF